MNILIIDAQGGGIGRQLVLSVKKALPDAEILAVGTNAAATAAMLKAGASSAATGENAVVFCARKADVIVGPVGIVIADSMLGEITPKMALAVARSDAKRVLIPFSHCDTVIAGTETASTTELIQKAVTEVQKLCGAS